MILNKYLPAGLYCPNPSCVLFGRVTGFDLSVTPTMAQIGAFSIFVENADKPSQKIEGHFFGLQTPREKVLTALNMIAEGGGIRATGRAIGVDKDTVKRWVKRSGNHVEEVSAYLVVDCHLSEAQLDGLWAFVKKKTQASRRRTIRKRSESSSSGAP